MIEFNLTIVVMVILLVASLIDFYNKSVPSIFLTGTIFVILLVNFMNFESGMVQLCLGVVGLVFGLLLYEAKFFNGVADIKVIVIIAMMVATIPSLFQMFVLVMVFGFAHLCTFRFILKGKHKEEVPFLFSLFAVYVTLYLLGGLT